MTEKNNEKGNDLKKLKDAIKGGKEIIEAIDETLSTAESVAKKHKNTIPEMLSDLIPSFNINFQASPPREKKEDKFFYDIILKENQMEIVINGFNETPNVALNETNDALLILDQNDQIMKKIPFPQHTKVEKLKQQSFKNSVLSLTFEIEEKEKKEGKEEEKNKEEESKEEVSKLKENDKSFKSTD